MEEICAAQGPPPVVAELGSHVHEVLAERSGAVEAIDCLRIATVARLAGAPTDPGAGLQLLRKTGERVAKGEPLYRIHASEPADFGWSEAAAFPHVTVTAWHMLVTRANVQPGEDVLVHAAGSGVGSIAIQIAKLRGARVITTASSDEKLAHARELGADESVNYTSSDWPKEVRRLTDRAGVDVVVEHTGAATWPGSIASLKAGGRLVTCGATSGYDAHTDLRQVFYRHLNILGSFMGSKAELLEAMKFVEQGKIRGVVDRVLPLSEARQAHELIENRAQFGKVVLKP
jgi:NADPH:quinone reductase-like Zn-dependent oxidoreductase